MRSRSKAIGICRTVGPPLAGCAMLALSGCASRPHGEVIMMQGAPAAPTAASEERGSHGEEALPAHRTIPISSEAPTLFGELPEARVRAPVLPELPPWPEAERLAREKEVLGFFISGHPLEPFRPEVELFGTRTTATLGQWSEQVIRVAGVITAVRRQLAKKSGKEYARLTLEDFHGTAEVLVFPEAWARLNQVLREDVAVLLTGGYSPRDRDEERATLVVESARPLTELRDSGAVGVALRWHAPAPPEPDLMRRAAALCANHPGPAPVYIEWSDGNGDAVRLRARRLKVEPRDEVVHALKALLGAEAVHYVKAG